MRKRSKALKRHREQTRLWAQARGYWKEWRNRTENEPYRLRDNRRRRRARLKAKRAAKQCQLKVLRAERISAIRRMAAQTLAAAKQSQIARLGNEIADYLWWRDCAAKQCQIDRAPSGAG